MKYFATVSNKPPEHKPSLIRDQASTTIPKAVPRNDTPKVWGDENHKVVVMDDEPNDSAIVGGAIWFLFFIILSVIYVNLKG